MTSAELDAIRFPPGYFKLPTSTIGTHAMRDSAAADLAQNLFVTWGWPVATLIDASNNGWI